MVSETEVDASLASFLRALCSEPRGFFDLRRETVDANVEVLSIEALSSAIFWDWEWDWEDILSVVVEVGGGDVFEIVKGEDWRGLVVRKRGSSSFEDRGERGGDARVLD